jgi:hypothetical protein
MNTEERIMRLHIDGSWTAKDMADSLFSMRELYNIRLGLQVVHEEYRDFDEFFFELRHFPPFTRRFKRRYLNPFLFQALTTAYFQTTADPGQMSRLIYPDEELKVRRIEYSSPGYKDLAGFGEIVGHLKDFILKIIEHFSSRRGRNLEDEEQELKNQALRIQNARDFVSLAKECGFEESEVRRLVYLVDEKQTSLVRLVGEGKIQKVLMLDEAGSQEER